MQWKPQQQAVQLTVDRWTEDLKNHHTIQYNTIQEIEEQTQPQTISLSERHFGSVNLANEGIELKR